MKFFSLATLFLALSSISIAQNDNNMNQPPYYEIPESPSAVGSGAIMSRMIDGLGFRYYWATESLVQEDLDFRFTEESRSSLETCTHIFDLSNVILCAAKQIAVEKAKAPEDFEALRRKTLENFQEASALMLNYSDEELEQCKLVFGSGSNATTYPIWNLINGPIEDVVWHAGQIVSMRRASGNPFNSKASVLSGKVRD